MRVYKPCPECGYSVPTDQVCPDCFGERGDGSLRDVVAPPPAIQPPLGAGRHVAPEQGRDQERLTALLATVRRYGEAHVRYYKGGTTADFDAMENLSEELRDCAAAFYEAFPEPAAASERKPEHRSPLLRDDEALRSSIPQTEASGRRND